MFFQKVNVSEIMLISFFYMLYYNDNAFLMDIFHKQVLQVYIKV